MQTDESCVTIGSVQTGKGGEMGMTDDKKREILAQVGRVNSDICYGCPIIERYLELMSAQPEIVRCKECRWAEVSDSEHTWCDHVDHEFCHNNDWFCADGERQ